MCAYLVLLRVEIARFTHMLVAQHVTRLCCSNPQLIPCGFHWRVVNSYAALCSPDLPPVPGFPYGTSGGLAGFTILLSQLGVYLVTA